MEPGGLALLAGDASVDSWFREIHVPWAWRVYLATGFDFHEKKSCFFWVDRSPSLLWVSYLATLLWRKGDEDYFSQKLRVRIKDNKNSPHGKFHWFLFPFSSKFSDINFASYVLYNLPVMSRVTHSEPGLPMMLVDEAEGRINYGLKEIENLQKNDSDYFWVRVRLFTVPYFSVRS